MLTWMRRPTSVIEYKRTSRRLLTRSSNDTKRTPYFSKRSRRGRIVIILIRRCRDPPSVRLTGRIMPIQYFHSKLDGGRGDFAHKLSRGNMSSTKQRGHSGGTKQRPRSKNERLR